MLDEIKYECHFIRELLKEELIKDYKTENIDRVKVTQMALFMGAVYNGPIDGNRSKTFDLLQEHYKWSNTVF